MLLGLLTASIPVRTFAADPSVFQSNEDQVTLLELFTSEGCSSCPPAEKWLSSLTSATGLWSKFVPVAFHVDYWDYLGWRDAWGRRDFSDRQRDYAQHWGSDSIYTPGFVLNGREWRSWSRQKEGPPVSGLKTGMLKVSSTDQVHWKVSFSPAAGASGYEAHAALLANGLTSDVKAGENQGRGLNHDFVVIALTANSLSKEGEHLVGELKFDRRDKTASKRLAIAVWVTRAGNLDPVQAVGGWLPN
jgi:hypothetical protein